MKSLVISVHDMSPKFLSELKLIFEGLNDLGIKKYDLLIVPSWKGKNPIDKNKEFVKLVKKHLTKNSALVLHGFTHMPKPEFYKDLPKIAGPGRLLEFVSISKKQIEDKIKMGLNLIKKTFGIVPKGFVPPAWFVDENSKEVIKRYFDYYTTYGSVNYLNHKIKSKALFYSGGGVSFYNKFVTFVSSLITNFSKNKLIRVTIHPEDMKTGSFQIALENIKSLLKRGWKLALYEDFIKK